MTFGYLDFAETISLLIFKISIVFAAVFIIFLGYKLFCKGIFDNAGSLNAEFNFKKIVLKQGAPGTFFVLFGTIILSFATWKGINFKDKSIIKNHLNDNTQITDTNQNDAKNVVPINLPEKPPF